MSRYRWELNWCVVSHPSEINRLIQSEDEEPGLTSAEQIICLMQAPGAGGHMVVWRERRWID